MRQFGGRGRRGFISAFGDEIFHSGCLQALFEPLVEFVGGVGAHAGGTDDSQPTGQVQARHALLAEGGHIRHDRIALGGGHTNDHNFPRLCVLNRGRCRVEIGLHAAFQKVAGGVCRAFVGNVRDGYFAGFAKSLGINM